MFEKGDYVFAKESGSGVRTRGYGAVRFAAGEELIVTSARGGYLNVRRNGGYVFKIAASKVRGEARMLGQVPPGGISLDDPRIAWLFEDAGRLADRLGLCRDYDRLCDALGAPGRIRPYTIKLEVSDAVVITAKVEARSRTLAEKALREQFGPRPLAVTA